MVQPGMQGVAVGLGGGYEDLQEQRRKHSPCG